MVRSKTEASTRTTPFVSRSPRVPLEGPPDYLDKLDSRIVGLTRLLRGAAEAPAPNPEVPDLNDAAANRRVAQRSDAHIPVAALAAWPQTLGEMFDLLSKFPDPRIAEACSAINEKLTQEMRGIDLNDGLLNVLSLLRYKKTYRELQQSERQGNRKASRQAVEVMHLNNRWLHGQLPRGGVPFKTNPGQILFMLYGLLAGVERLTSSELVQFFDDNCPCGKEIHNQQVLERLRTRLQNRISRISQIDDANGQTAT
jgi:hypothetical protein